jgi:hypothetical protein
MYNDKKVVKHIYIYNKNINMLRTEFLKTKKCEICNNNFDSFSEHSEYRLFLKHLKINII